MDTELPNRLALEELSNDELELMIGLMLQLAEADSQVSPEESEQLKLVAAELGRDRFMQCAKAARERFGDLGALFERAAGVMNGEVQRTIFQVVRDLALGDGIVREEAALLERLAALWRLDWSPD